MLLHKLFQRLLFLLLLTCRLPLSLHLLVVHHLFHHAPRFAVEVAQFGILRLDFSDVDFGGVGDHVGPPLGFVNLIEVDSDFFARRGGRFEGPGAFIRVDGGGEVALLVSITSTSNMDHVCITNSIQSHPTRRGNHPSFSHPWSTKSYVLLPRPPYSKLPQPEALFFSTHLDKHLPALNSCFNLCLVDIHNQIPRL